MSHTFPFAHWSADSVPPCQHADVSSSFAGASLVPSSIFLNGEKCILVNVGGQTVGLTSNGTAGKESVEQPLSLSGPNIIGTDGNVVNFQGLNWFGFEVSTLITVCVVLLSAHHHKYG